MPAKADLLHQLPLARKTWDPETWIRTEDIWVDVPGESGSMVSPEISELWDSTPLPVGSWCFLMQGDTFGVLSSTAASASLTSPPTSSADYQADKWVQSQQNPAWGHAWSVREERNNTVKEQGS